MRPASQGRSTGLKQPLVQFSHGGEHLAHSNNFVGTSVLPDDMPGRFVIDVQSVKNTYAEWWTFTVGWRGLGKFLVFLFLYLYMLSFHACEPAVGEVNVGLKNAVDLTKADMKVKNVDTLWKFMTNQYLNLVFSGTWEFKNSKNETITGRKTANQRFLVVGMASITAVKSEADICYKDHPCYSADNQLQDPFADLVLPNSETVKIPYNKFTGGYTVGIPAGATAKEQAALLKAFQPFFGQETTGVHIQTILFNPHGRKTITSLVLKGSFSVYGEVSFEVELDTIPYEPYNGSFHFTVLLEVLVVILALKWFVQPYFVYWFREPNFRLAKGLEKQVQYLRWLHKWEHLARCPFGQATRAYVPLFVGLVGAMILRLCFVASYSTVYNEDSILATADVVSESSLPSIYMNMQKKDNDHSTKLIVDSLSIVHGYLPLLDALSRISLLNSYYFVWQTFTAAVMLWLLVEHLRFQKRLSHMTDTLKGVSKEVFGLFFLVFIVCCMIGVMCSLAYGSLDPNFRSVWASFLPVLETCLGLFRPQTDMNLRSPPPYKYVPHIGVEGAAEWMPTLLMLVFKMVVFMFIFKLLMGVVMSAWRDSRKGVSSRSHLADTSAQLKLMIHYGVSYYWHHKVKGEPFVRWDVLCLALQSMPPPADPTGHGHFFLGIDGTSTQLRDVLNQAVSSENIHKQSDSWQHAMIHVMGQTDKMFTDAHADFAMKAYGRRRRGAVAALVEEERKRIYASKLAELTDHYAEQRKRTAKEYAEQEALKVLANLGSDVTERDIMLRKPPREMEDKVFQSCDVFCIGQVHFLFMEEVLERLGFSLNKDQLHKLLQAYDEDMNMTMDREELHRFIHDEQLCGRKTEDKINAEEEQMFPEVSCCSCFHP